MELLGKTNIDFIGKRNIAATASKESVAVTVEILRFIPVSKK